MSGIQETYTTNYAYRADDILTKITDNKGNQFLFEYDTLGRRVSYDDPNMEKWVYSYDLNGNLVNQTDGRGINVSITYDSAAGGADFIVRKGSESLVFEVGYGEKSFQQLETTMRKSGVNARYGILISQSPLAIDAEKNTVSIPLSYFLLT